MSNNTTKIYVDERKLEEFVNESINQIKNNNDLSNIQSLIDENNAKINRTLADINTNIVDITAKTSSNDKNIENNSENIDSLNTKVSNLENFINSSSENIDNLNTRLTNLGNSVESSSEKLLQVEKNTNEISVEFMNFRDESNQKSFVESNTIDEINQSLKNLSVDVLELPNDFQQFKNECNDLFISKNDSDNFVSTSSFESLNNKVQNNSTEITGLNEKVLVNEQNITTNTQDINELDIKVSNLENSVNTSSEKINVIDENIETINNNYVNLSSKIQTNEEKIEEINGKITLNEQNITNNTNNIEVLRSEQQTISTKLNEEVVLKSSIDYDEATKQITISDLKIPIDSLNLNVDGIIEEVEEAKTIANESKNLTEQYKSVIEQIPVPYNDENSWFEISSIGQNGTSSIMFSNNGSSEGGFLNGVLNFINIFKIKDVICEKLTESSIISKLSEHYKQRIEELYENKFKNQIPDFVKTIIEEQITFDIDIEQDVFVCKYVLPEDKDLISFVGKQFRESDFFKQDIIAIRNEYYTTIDNTKNLFSDEVKENIKSTLNRAIAGVIREKYIDIADSLSQKLNDINNVIRLESTIELREVVNKTIDDNRETIESDFDSYFNYSTKTPEEFYVDIVYNIIDKNNIKIDDIFTKLIDIITKTLGVTNIKYNLVETEDILSFVNDKLLQNNNESYRLLTNLTENILLHVKNSFVTVLPDDNTITKAIQDEINKGIDFDSAVTTYTTKLIDEYVISDIPGIEQTITSWNSLTQQLQVKGNKCYQQCQNVFNDMCIHVASRFKSGGNITVEVNGKEYKLTNKKIIFKNSSTVDVVAEEDSRGNLTLTFNAHYYRYE